MAIKQFKDLRMGSKFLWDGLNPDSPQIFIKECDVSAFPEMGICCLETDVNLLHKTSYAINQNEWIETKEIENNDCGISCLKCGYEIKERNFMQVSFIDCLCQ